MVTCMLAAGACHCTGNLVAFSSVCRQTWPSGKVTVKPLRVTSYVLIGALLTTSSPPNTSKMPERLGGGGGPVRTSARVTVAGSTDGLGCTDSSLSCAWGAGDRPSHARIGCAAP